MHTHPLADESDYKKPGVPACGRLAWFKKLFGMYFIQKNSWILRVKIDKVHKYLSNWSYLSIFYDREKVGGFGDCLWIHQKFPPKTVINTLAKK